MSDEQDRTASLMTPAKLAQLKARPAAAASPAAWLDQLASDAGSGHVRRLLDLRRQLEAQVREPDAAPVRAAASGLAEALDRVDFALLQPKGWLARATGKGKEAAATFVAQVERGVRAGEELAEEARALQRRQQAQGGAVDRTALEVEVEVRAIEKIMDQGARWLQDMRNQLKEREAGGGDAAALQKIQEDTRRCELLVARLKQLRSADAAAQNVLEQCRALATRRGALAAALQPIVDAGWKGCERQLAALADQAAASGGASAGVEAARQACQALAGALRQAASEAAALQSQQQAVADAVVALQPPLQAAA